MTGNKDHEGHEAKKEVHSHPHPHTHENKPEAKQEKKDKVAKPAAKDKVKESVSELVSFLQRKGFVWGPEPEIYGGIAGFYTYGPLGKLLKNNVENMIRKTFGAEGFFEVECPIVMERKVWEASGHLSGFSDAVVTCSKCNAVFRLDHLLGDYPETRHFKEPKEFLDFIAKHKVKCTSCGSDFKQEVKKHDLMMRTTIGMDTEAYNRPETATTTYLPFLRYQEYFRKKPTFGVFQIGKAFRNEISPRQHVVRGREFTQAEAQFFIKKELKNNFDQFKAVENDELPLWDYKAQEKAEPVKKLSLKEALVKGCFKSQAYAWAINLAFKFFRNIGIPEENIRMRQHFPDEKAFYADDAWDVEVKTKSFGWVEMCGVHDRTDYDLTQHAKFSGTELMAYDEETKEKYVPHVLEIAFGSDRPTFAILDTFYDQKSVDEGKTTLKIPYKMSPIPVAVFPLMKKPELAERAERIYDSLNKEFVCVYDESGAIGRRYLRAAEAGTAYCITVDYETLEGEETVTLRDRDTEKQKRVKTSELRDLLRKLLLGDKKFEEIE
ncbi:glycine--tRNA ligase [Candidatus Woesearchaeota archaeon]|nr:glycine--tRNA ligase [Candidatus Woesearchaeota archaeon]